ncbi:MAG TPA: hypothetical protein VMU87_05005 [Stellaceae bacterium]|nr:hypothetical protein [Stellaceae bacterium]
MPDTQEPAAKSGSADGGLLLGYNDLRDKIPVLGLKEYWYPASHDRAVGWR